MDPASLVIGLVTGCIGFAAWRYGRVRNSLRYMLLGTALIGYSWVVDDPMISAAVGLVLTGLLFWPRP
jgi:hypothetical protein